MLEQTRAIEARNRGPCSTVYVVRAFLTMDFVLSLCEILSSVEGGPERARPGGATLPCASICSIRATLRRTVPKLRWWVKRCSACTACGRVTRCSVVG